MKKKLVPLLAVAFVIAVISTGIFYGLFVHKLTSAASAPPGRPVVVATRDLERGAQISASDLQLIVWSGGEPPHGAFAEAEAVVGSTVTERILTNEPLTQLRLAKASGGLGDSSGVPAGKRAISLHVADSSGIIEILRPGHRVDVQMIMGNPPEARLKTVAQSLEVLSVIPQPQQTSARTPLPVVTLLAAPEESDRLALADSAARVRLTLRNSLDSEQKPRHSMALASLLRNAAPAATVAKKAPPSGEELLLKVRIAGAASSAIEQLGQHLLTPRDAELVQISASVPGAGIEGVFRRLETERQIDVLSATELQTGNEREVSVQAGAQSPLGDGCELRVRFLPTIRQNGRLLLRIQPEVSSPGRQGIATRRFATELELVDGQSFLVAGLGNSLETNNLVERLFSRESPAPPRDLVVFVTPTMNGRIQTAAARLDK